MGRRSSRKPAPGRLRTAFRMDAPAPAITNSSPTPEGPAGVPTVYTSSRAVKDRVRALSRPWPPQDDLRRAPSATYKHSLTQSNSSSEQDLGVMIAASRHGSIGDLAIGAWRLMAIRSGCNGPAPWGAGTEPVHRGACVLFRDGRSGAGPWLAGQETSTLAAPASWALELAKPSPGCRGRKHRLCSPRPANYSTNRILQTWLVGSRDGGNHACHEEGEDHSKQPTTASGWGRPRSGR